MAKKSWTRLSSVKKRTKDEATTTFNQIFQALSQNLHSGLPITASENQEQAGKLFKPSVLMDSTAL